MEDYMEDMKKNIMELADSIAGQYAVDIVDVELAGSSRKPLIRIFIDKQNGVTLDDCGKFSRALSALFDVEDPIPTAYVLEVSSPGLDRPLKALRDFQRSIGKLARIITRAGLEKRNIFTGRITGVAGENITLSFDDKEMEIPFDQISKARLEIELK
ncbi:MAG: ribosome maturation factor RimP [Nitrospira bacterium HGW-Nitrospira-1]|nr:MAG: ribosome maturation factor RimP [Nitrospira bacterium HGW-Nitrospira-1]